jgi:hypothetical protein
LRYEGRMKDCGSSDIELFFSRDDYLPHLTTDSVAEALKECPLSLTPGRDAEWLAMATRRALSITRRMTEYGSGRVSAVKIRKELERLASAAERAWAAIFSRSEAADHTLWNIAFDHWEGVNALAAMEDPYFPYIRFRHALSELEWLADFVQTAARETKAQPPNWKLKADREIRVERGHCLAPIFEAAFGEPISVNNWPNAPRKTPFMDFYQRMVSIAYRERSTPDLSGVLKQAQRAHRKMPIEFAEGVIPGM